jgi:hypothetical protein
VIVVTGSKRSGTSMWMQILGAAGFPLIGSAFPSNWGETIRDANPRGFYESKLAAGIAYGTNPDPQTGHYLFPDETRQHAVKVFAPGVLRSDIAFLDRVIVTVRPWREHTASLARLRALRAAAEDLDPSRAGGEALPPAVEWWCDLYLLIRDVATRRYPVHFQSYPELLAAPESVLARVLSWIGRGDRDAAVAAVDAALHRNRAHALVVEEPLLPAGCVGVFDDLYERIAGGSPLDDPFIARLNDTHRALVPLLASFQAREQEAALRTYLAEVGAPPIRAGAGRDQRSVLRDKSTS